jgi:hypothetical protein
MIEEKRISFQRDDVLVGDIDGFPSAPNSCNVTPVDYLRSR